jgi:integrase
MNDDSLRSNSGKIAGTRNRSKHPKTSLKYWQDAVFKNSSTRDGKRIEGRYYAVSLTYRGERKILSTGTSNVAAAAARAKEMYTFLQGNGWETTLAIYRPEMASRKVDITLGDYLAAVEEYGALKTATRLAYATRLRYIVSEALGIKGGDAKYDYVGGRRDEWISQVHSVRLSRITPAVIDAWRIKFLKAGNHGKVAKISVNSYLRQARSLFSKKILKAVAPHLALPSPLPFDGIELEPRQSMKYQSTVDLPGLFSAAMDELSVERVELFKVFLLAVAVGLRRKEIDLLEWGSFDWGKSTIEIKRTAFFQAKSEDSYAHIPLEQEILELFRGYHAKASGKFVIESNRVAVKANWNRYRCDAILDELAQWLRSQGVNSDKPLHVLRKEFGSQIADAHGIFAASKMLRHSGIAITNDYYLDRTAKVSAGMAHLLKSGPLNVVPIEGTIPKNLQK